MFCGLYKTISYSYNIKVPLARKEDFFEQRIQG